MKTEEEKMDCSAMFTRANVISSAAKDTTIVRMVAIGMHVDFA